jgi:hypothetical protein
MTKTRAYEGVGQERNGGITVHVPRSVGKCEGMNPPHSQMSPYFGSLNFDGFLNFQRVIARVKTNWIE